MDISSKSSFSFYDATVNSRYEGLRDFFCDKGETIYLLGLQILFQSFLLAMQCAETVDFVLVFAANLNLFTSGCFFLAAQLQINRQRFNYNQ